MVPPAKRDTKSKYLNGSLTGSSDEPGDLLKLRDGKIARLEEKIRNLNLTACMQERLSDWRGKYFTKVVIRLKPSA